ncbi:MAG: Cna domain protein [Edaphobacter sp.]|nr:Cna domain protein [Edaphobacter sp.]
MRRTFSFVLVLFLVLLSTSFPAFAAITGIVSGTITDPSGAAVPGVDVVALNEATGISLETKTDGKGFYSFNALDVGSYTVSATLLGFQKSEVTKIKVDANSSIKNDITMQVGSVSETTQVTSSQVQIETQNTQLGEVIESQKITAVPLNGRSYTDLLSLQPGVSPYTATTEGSATSTSGNLNPGNQSVNGGREGSNGFMVNGANVTDGYQDGASIIPTLDSISEFRIITSNFDAEYGNFSGGQVNVVTKSGTNQIHGEAYEFFRNTALNARNFYASPTAAKPPFNQNIFGGTFGMPIKRDKIFFFGDFQATKQTAANTTNNLTVPTAANLAGDLSNQAAVLDKFARPNGVDFTNGGGVVGTGWANTLSTRLGYTVNPGEPYYYTGCTLTSQCVFPNAQIPQTAWSSTAVPLSKYIPAPNTSGAFNYVTSLPGSTTDYKGAGRLDVNTKYGTIFGYYFLDDDHILNPYAGGSVGGFAGVTSGRAQMVNLGLTTIFKNNQVNTLRIAYVRSALHTNAPLSSGPDLASLGFVTPWGPTGGIDVVNPALKGVPNIAFSNFSIGTPNSTNIRVNNSYQILDNYAIVAGEHTMQFGINYHYDQINGRNFYAVNGQYSYAGGNETGLDTLDFLLGASNSLTQATPQLLDSRSHYAGGYAQDSWRILSNLTLNYGIRYEVSTPWYDTQNKIETIIPGQQSIVFPGAPKGWVFPGDPGVPRTLAPIKWNKFAPRFGFSYTPTLFNGKMAIRGGYGIFYTNYQDQSGFVEIGDAPYGLYYSSPVPVRTERPYVDRATGNVQLQKFPFTFPPTNVSATNPDNNVPWANYLPLSSSDAVSIHNTVPYNQDYYLGIQQELLPATVLTINYVGNVGRHLANAVEANPGDPALCLSLTAAVLAPGQTPCGPKLETQVYTLAGGGTVQGTRPTLGIAFGSNPYLQTQASSNYNSLQTSVKHISPMWDVLVSYTWSRSFDNGSGLTDQTYVYNPRRSYGLSKFDVTNNFAASYNLRLPFGQHTDRRWARVFLGGWSLAGITRFATGIPVNLSESDDRSLVGCGCDLPNYTGQSLTANADRNPRNNRYRATAVPYFNTGAFSIERLGVYGNSHRRFFHGPGINNTDLAVLRDFHIHEGHTVQFRAEAFNTWNHAQFNNPGSTVNTTSTFGLVSSARPARIYQIAAKYRF